jgi:hypothetical protein
MAQITCSGRRAAFSSSPTDGPRTASEKQGSGRNDQKYRYKDVCAKAQHSHVPESKRVFVEGLSGGRLGVGMRGSCSRLSHYVGYVQHLHGG